MAEQFANGAQSSLSSGILDDDSTLTVVSATGFPTTGNFRILIKAEASYTDEICTVTGVSGNTFTVTRASEAIRGTQAASIHSAGAEVIHVLTAGSIATSTGILSWEDAVASVSGKVHRWKFEEGSGYPQDSIGTLHMVSGTVSSRQIATPTGYGMTFTSLSPTGYGNLPVGNNSRSFVFIWKTASADTSATDIFAYGPTSSSRQWNHICANHDNYAQTGILFWDDDWKKGHYITDANWHLLVFRYAARAIDINVDGISVAEGTTGAVLNTGTSGTCYLGSVSVSQSWSDAIVFNRWITNAEVGRLWNSIRSDI